MDSQVAVKAVIQNMEGNRWQAVGGRLEKGEKLEEGLRREVEEETGIVDLNVGKVIHVDEWFAKPEGKLKHIVALFFRCKTDSAEITLSDEHQGYAWVSVDELKNYRGLIEKEIEEAILIADI